MLYNLVLQTLRWLAAYSYSAQSAMPLVYYHQPRFTSSCCILFAQILHILRCKTQPMHFSYSSKLTKSCDTKAQNKKLLTVFAAITHHTIFVKCIILLQTLFSAKCKVVQDMRCAN